MEKETKNPSSEVMPGHGGAKCTATVYIQANYMFIFFYHTSRTGKEKLWHWNNAREIG